VSLIADYQGICFDTATRAVNVGTTPIADFAFTGTTGAICGGPATLVCTNASQFAAAYVWDLGNGTVATTANASATYPAVVAPPQVSRIVQLIANNAFGCSDTTSQVFTLYPQPVASFALNDNLGCYPLPVTATSTSTNATGYTWNFGNGATGSAASAGTTYAAPGTFSVSLIADYQGICFDTATRAVNVGTTPIADFAFADTTGILCGGPVTVLFDNRSQFSDRWVWAFGDAAQSLSPLFEPSFSYAQPDTYAVALVAGNTFGCSDTIVRPFVLLPLPKADFVLDTTYGCPPLLVGITNTSSVYTSLTLTYGEQYTLLTVPDFTTIGTTYNVPDQTYTITLVANHNNQCFDTATQTVRVARSPIASFAPTLTGDVCRGPMKLSVQNTSQFGTGYFWNFGNGADFSLDENPQPVVYQQAGTYVVRLLASNDLGCSDSADYLFTLYPTVTAQLAVDTVSGCVPLTVTFDGRPSVNESTYQWGFGDGATSTDSVPAHTYSQFGTYDIMLVASIGGVCPDTLHKQGLIEVLMTPIADFTAAPAGTVTADGKILFTNRTLFADFYEWDFGDGGGSVEENPIRRFSVNDSFAVALYAENQNGCRDTAVRYVRPPFFGNLQIPNAFAPTSSIDPDARVFKPVGIGLETFHLKVYSAEGNVLWETTALDAFGAPTEAWDGTDRNGKPIAATSLRWDVVAAVFKDNSIWTGMRYQEGAKPSLSGTVTIIR